MKVKLLRQVYMMSRFLFYGICLQSFLSTMLIASDSHGQKTSIYEIYLSVDYEETTLKKVFSDLEKKTGFKFTYNNAFTNRKQLISLTSESQTLGDILLFLSKEGGLSFKRINNNIHVGAIAKNNVKEQVSEVIAQQVRISGNVTDEGGEPLPGVSILIKGTSKGTTTDIDGNYNLSAPEGSVLQFSYIGFITQEVAVSSQTQLNISLVADLAQLEEVIVIGYGTAKKSDLTGAVTRLDATKLDKQAPTNLLELLNGTVAGFNSTQGASAAGGGSLEIRGANSLTASTSPLVVLDGVIYNGSLTDINPNDIESIDVLKDASAAAVYGSRAASGVLIVTTKKGSGKTNITLSSKIGVAQIANDIKPYDADGYLDFRRDYFRAADRGAPEFFYHNPNELPSSVSLEEWRNFASTPNDDNTLEWLNRLNFFPEEIEAFQSGNTVDWYDMVTQAGLRQTHDVSISGKKDATSYYMSFGYTKNEGVVVGDEFETYRTRLNLDTKVNEWLNVGMNAQFSVRDFSSVPAGFGEGDLLSVYRTSPYAFDRDEDGDFVLLPHGYILAVHPLSDHLAKQEQNIRNSLFGVMYANVKLPLGFNYRISFQNRYDFNRDYNFWPSSTSRGGINNSSGGLGFGSRQEVTQHEWMVDNILSWNKEFGDHAFDATFLFNVEELNSTSSRQTGSNFSPNENLGFNGLQFSEFQSIANNDLTRTADALMGRINYRFKDKYLLTASVRRDGFSAFGQANPRATFPALALGWVVSEESFFPETDILSNLKLRLSWGENGNRSVGTYTALASLRSVVYLTETGTAQGVDLASLPNENLRWEQTESLNLGIDFGLFSNRIDGSLELYSATTTDLLVQRQLPRITGFNSVISNLGEVQNKGIELTLNTVNVDNSNFTWRSNIIFSLNRNEIVELFGDTETVTINGEEITRPVADIQNGWFPGEPIDRIWNYRLDGVWQLGEEEQAAAYGQVPGDFRAVDVNGDSLYTQLEDRQFIGFSEPRFRLGFRNEFSFLKNFTFSFFLRGEFGHKGQMPELLHSGTAIYDRINTYNLPYWSQDNPTNEYGSLAQSNGAFEGGFNVYRSRSYLRVQDVTLSYSIPEDILGKIGATRASVFSSIRNLYTFTNWEGWDPETGVGTASGNVPMPRIITFGFNLNL